MKRTIQTLALVTALTLPWIALQGANGGGSGGTTQQQCKASEDGAGCENANAKCKTSGGVDGKCTVSSIPSNPCRCIPGN